MEELEDNKILYKQKIICIQKQEVRSRPILTIARSEKAIVNKYCQGLWFWVYLYIRSELDLVLPKA